MTRKKMKIIIIIIKKWSYSHMLISGSERLMWTSPAQHVYCYGVFICPCVSPPSFSILLSQSHCCQVTKTGSSPFVPYLLPSSRSTLCLPMPCFPYFGMSMCYLLTLCMNDNMSVYSYRELYPISLVLTKKGLNVVQIQVFLFFCSVTFCNVCRA